MLTPQWQTGRIPHRYGTRTLTVLSEAVPGALPSQILQAAQSQIGRLDLPPG